MTLKENKDFKIFSIVTVMFLSCSACHSQNLIESNIRRTGSIPNIKSEVKISYWNDEGFIAKNPKGISIRLETGFDTLQQISFYINDSLIESFACKTNYSIDYCLLDDKAIEIAELYLSNKVFKEGNVLKIVAGDSYINILLENKMKNYNKLSINKASKWTAGFQNSTRVEFVE